MKPPRDEPPKPPRPPSTPPGTPPPEGAEHPAEAYAAGYVLDTRRAEPTAPDPEHDPAAEQRQAEAYSEAFILEEREPTDRRAPPWFVGLLLGLGLLMGAPVVYFGVQTWLNPVPPPAPGAPLANVSAHSAAPIRSGAEMAAAEIGPNEESYLADRLAEIDIEKALDREGPAGALRYIDSQRAQRQLRRIEHLWIARLAQDTGQLATARRALEAAPIAADEPPQVAALRLRQALLEGDLGRAAETFRAQLDNLKRADDPRLDVLGELALQLVQRRRMAEALALLPEPVALLRAPLLLLRLDLLLRSYLQEPKREVLLSAGRTLERGRTVLGALDMAAARAALEFAAGRPEVAVAAWREAFAQADAEHNPAQLVALGEMARLHGRADLTFLALDAVFASKHGAQQPVDAWMSHLGQALVHAPEERLVGLLERMAALFPENLSVRHNLLYLRLIRGSAGPELLAAAEAMQAARPDSLNSQAALALARWRAGDTAGVGALLAAVDPANPALSDGNRAVFAALSRRAGQPERAGLFRQGMDEGRLLTSERALLSGY